MRLVTKIVLSLALVVILTSVVSVTLLAFLRVKDAAVTEVSHSYEQTLAIQTILGAANDYAEQLAELFVLGASTQEVETARNELLEAIGVAESEVQEEIKELRSTAESAESAAEIIAEQMELDRMLKLRGLVEQLEEARIRISTALTERRFEDARVIYRDTVESRLDTLLDRQLDTIVDRERREVADALIELNALSSRMRAVVFGLVVAMLLATAALAIFLRRSVLRPVTALAEGTHAVAEGNFSYKVEVLSEDEFGRLADRFNIMTDKIRRQHEALISAKEGLEDQVRERTDELRAAAAQHKGLAESRARVLADLSHELRTPLTVVRGKAEVTLRDTAAGVSEMRSALERIVVKGEQMSRLVDDMLFVARSEAGAIPVQRRPVVLQDVLADVLLDSRELSRRKDITILPRQPTDAVTILGDADRLRQAVLILLDNAVRIAPAGSSVSVTLACEDDRALIRVSDIGPGFAAEEAERAFSRFWRGKGGAAGHGRGSGLGLSIAYWIMQQHDGAILLQNHKGGGATVRLELLLESAKHILPGDAA